MTARTGRRQAPGNSAIPARSGVARTAPPTPPGERGAAPEGAVPRVTPTPTRPRVIVPLPEVTSGLAESLPRRHGWRVDDINGAPDAPTALKRLCEWARAEEAKCRKTRPGDADAFCWQMIHKLAPLIAAISRSHPAPEFLACPKLPGGGWSPRRPAQRAAEARPPGGRR